MRLIRKALSTREGTLVFAILAAVLAAGALMVFISGYKRSLATNAEPLTVLVAKESLAKGSSGDAIAEKGLFQATGLKREHVKEGAITDPASLRGQVARHDIVNGQQLTAADFAKPTDPVLSRLSDKSRAVSVPLDPAHGLIGQVQAGDHVDVFAGFQVQPEGATRPRSVLRVLLQDVEVLSAPPPGEEGGGPTGSAETQNVVLRVDEKDAPQLAFSVDNGKVWLSLRPQAGAEQDPPSLVTVDRLLAGMDPIPVDQIKAQAFEEGL